MARILITDGDERAALAIVRSLGQVGHHCVVAGETGRTLAGRSRHAQREVCVPDVGSSPAGYGAALKSVVQAEEIDIVIPVSEQALFAVLAVREAIPAALPFPELETFRAICDKERVLAAAPAVGIRVPRQWEIVSPSDHPDIEVNQPLVLKPARSVYTDADGTQGKVGVRWVRSSEEMEAALRAYPTAAYPLLAQERIVGPGIGVFVLVHEGRCLASFSHFRVREKPPSGGVSVVCRSEPMDEALLERSLALLARFSWSGVAMVEYKRDSSTGEPVLMEINGRFWGSLQLAIDAGVDFPRLLVDTALGLGVSTVHEYGLARSRWFWGDVDNLIARWRAPGATWRERLGAVVGWLRASGPGHQEEVFRWSDPHPFLHETAEWIMAGWRALNRSAG